MELYYTVISAFSRKCRILARELNIIHDMQEIVTTMRTANSLIMSINPTGKVPALVTTDNQLIKRKINRISCLLWSRTWW